MYGQVWRSQFKSDEFLIFVKSEWHQGLLAYADNVLDKAIELCRKSKELPPTLPKFIDFCEACSKKDSCFVPEKFKSSTPEIAETHLLKLKQILNMEINE